MPKFNLEQKQFSIILIRPRPTFFEWLKRVCERRSLKISDVYFPEEEGVWLIPATSTFDSGTELESYIYSLKHLLAKRELGKFGPSPEDTPKDWTAEVFDEFFTVEIRDSATCVDELLSK